MAEWTQCPSCQLKHVARPDGLCPRCRHPVASGWGKVSAPAPAAPASWESNAAPPPAPPGPPSADGWANVPSGVPPAPPSIPGGTAGSPFTVGGFIGGAFTTWGRNAVWVVPLCMLLYAPSAVTMYRMYAGISLAGSTPPDPTSLLAQMGATWVLLLILVPVAMLAVARAGVRRLQGEPLALGDMLGTALRCYLPAIALLFLVWMAALISAITIVVPFILLSAWAAALPAMISERLGPIAAMERSWRLTRGLRLQVFAGFLVVFVAVLAVYCVLYGVTAAAVVAALVGSGAERAERAMGTMGAIQAANMLFQGVYTSIFTTATAVAYHQLRIASEGPAAAHLERVFE